MRRTINRISISFYFPCHAQATCGNLYSCNVCQMRARERRTDLVPIRPIDRHEDSFAYLQANIIGPMGDDLHKYALVLTYEQSIHVTAF
jgi:hypothetical protein